MTCTATAAHKTLPLRATVQGDQPGQRQERDSAVNDRGPFYPDRIIDLSFAAREEARLTPRGTARVKVRASTHAGGGPPRAVRRR